MHLCRTVRHPIEWQQNVNTKRNFGVWRKILVGWLTWKIHMVEILKGFLQDTGPAWMALNRSLQIPSCLTIKLASYSQMMPRLQQMTHETVIFTCVLPSYWRILELKSTLWNSLVTLLTSDISSCTHWANTLAHIGHIISTCGMLVGRNAWRLYNNFQLCSIRDLGLHICFHMAYARNWSHVINCILHWQLTQLRIDFKISIKRVRLISLPLYTLHMSTIEIYYFSTTKKLIMHLQIWNSLQKRNSLGLYHFHFLYD